MKKLLISSLFCAFISNSSAFAQDAAPKTDSPKVNSPIDQSESSTRGHSRRHERRSKIQNQRINNQGDRREQFYNATPEQRKEMIENHRERRQERRDARKDNNGDQQQGTNSAPDVQNNVNAGGNQK